MIYRILCLVSAICCMGYAGNVSNAQVEDSQYSTSLADEEGTNSVNATNNTMNAETGNPEMMNAETADPEMMERMNAETADPEMMERMNAETADPEMMNANSTNSTG